MPNESNFAKVQWQPFNIWVLKVLGNQWHIQGLVWTYCFSQSESQKEAMGLSAWATGENVSYLHSESLLNTLECSLG